MWEVNARLHRSHAVLVGRERDGWMNGWMHNKRNMKLKQSKYSKSNKSVSHNDGFPQTYLIAENTSHIQTPLIMTNARNLSPL